jgi:alanyl-tRNA synthetase
MKSGMIKLNDTVTLKVDASNRMDTCRNHSATHLLQKALREVLGTHVEQAGSFQDAGRTRFDFSHFQAMTKEELKKVEDIVNEKIREGLSVRTDVMTLEEAKKSGAMALFGEKYGAEVRVVRMGDFSVELCGGTHVENTLQIGQFKIVSEAGVAAGVRRIEALTGENVRKYYENLEKEINAAAELVKATPATLADHIKSLQKELKDLKSENEALKSKEAKNALGNVMDNVTEVNGVKFLAAHVAGVDMNELRNLGDDLKAKLGEGVVLLISDKDGKVSMVAMATDAAVKAGAHAGNLIKAVAPIVGGGGGGRPNMAQAGGKDASKIDEAVKKADEVIKEQIN